MFRDRIDAGRQLAEELASYANDPRAVVLGIPRGGVVVAAEVARRLAVPLDIVIASKIGAPQNPEYAVGAVSVDGRVVPNPYAGYTESEIEHLGRGAKAKVERRVEVYRAGREPVALAGRTAIVVDDGIATGLTAQAAVAYVRRQGASHVILGVPVISAEAAERLEDSVDDLVAVERPRAFYAVGQFYRHFDQTSDDEVISALNEASDSR
jgi:putative phosphoribosyl transferase